MKHAKRTLSLLIIFQRTFPGRMPEQGSKQEDRRKKQYSIGIVQLAQHEGAGRRYKALWMY